MQLISKFNEGFRFLLCVIGIYIKYTWVATLKDKKGITITKAFQEILDESGRDKGSKFYNRSKELWLQDDDIEMHSTHNKEVFVVADKIY